MFRSLWAKSRHPAHLLVLEPLRRETGGVCCGLAASCAGPTEPHGCFMAAPGWAKGSGPGCGWPSAQRSGPSAPGRAARGDTSLARGDALPSPPGPRQPCGTGLIPAGPRCSRPRGAARSAERPPRQAGGPRAGRRCAGAEAQIRAPRAGAGTQPAGWARKHRGFLRGARP